MYIHVIKTVLGVPFVEIASVIAAYTATGGEQLSLNPGQLIQVRKKSPSGWWEGELQVRNHRLITLPTTLLTQHHSQAYCIYTHLTDRYR